jgi:hypothetical protein
LAIPTATRDGLERLRVRIESALLENETFEFVRIKQKFGLARIDWEGEVLDETRVRIGEAVNLATARSACTCEICGEPGRLFGHKGWLKTACDRHAVGDAVPVLPGWENVHLVRRIRDGKIPFLQTLRPREGFIHGRRSVRTGHRGIAPCVCGSGQIGTSN